MKIILTHEKADFDAISSLYTASLVFEGAQPVLPFNINRNVRAYLDFCGDALQFLTLSDLKNELIKEIILVDTQSLITLKGKTGKTKVHVIDHHQAKIFSDKNWTSEILTRGSTTSILVEKLKVKKTELTTLQATLMLLGIYEDTGGLTYSNTTPQDLIAAAYLLEKGANLEVATKYLNPPLDNNQSKIYQQLLSNTHYHNIHGNRIVIATADIGDENEEISSIAHYLRDALEPDALFVLIKMREGLRLVARSTSDQVNVGLISKQFGGGGHPRAAAGLLPADKTSMTLREFQDKLIESLNETVKPAIQAHQIMSAQPMLISPETRVEEVMETMTRFGFEGYPVVKAGKVVGLLNRRNVDRALAHKMNLTVASLMEPGEIFIRADDPLETIQKTMTSSGWGQIPVLNPENNDIIGIVTRTDLLKALGAVKTNQSETKNLADLLKSALPAVNLLLLSILTQHAQEQKTPLYIVGGFVRDLLLNMPSLDFDIVVEGDAIRFAQSLKTRYGGSISTHRRFGTAKWRIKQNNGWLKNMFPQLTDDDLSKLPETLDLISARNEFYDYPTALPQIKHSSIKQDLHRRDFTINTLALRLDGDHYGDLYNYWGGYEDLNAGLIKVLHSLSFVDDPTRLIRAIRFEQRFKFKIEERTFQLMSEAYDLVKHISGDRLRHELNLILQEKDPQPGLLRLQELGLLKQIHNDLNINPKIAADIFKILNLSLSDLDHHLFNGQILEEPLKLAYITWFMQLEGNLSQVLKRLKLPDSVAQPSLKANKAFRQYPEFLGKQPSVITAFLDTLSEEVLLVFHEVINDQSLNHSINQYISSWSKMKPTTTGDDLRSLGITPGPVYKEILSELRDAWINGLINSPETEQDYLDHLLFQKQIPGFN